MMKCLQKKAPSEERRQLQRMPPKFISRLHFLSSFVCLRFREQKNKQLRSIKDCVTEVGVQKLQKGVAQLNQLDCSSYLVFSFKIQHRQRKAQMLCSSSVSGVLFSPMMSVNRLTYQQMHHVDICSQRRPQICLADNLPNILSKTIYKTTVYTSKSRLMRNVKIFLFA